MFDRIAIHRPRCAAVRAAVTSPARAAASPSLDFVGGCETAGVLETMGAEHRARWHAGAPSFSVPTTTMADVLKGRLDYVDFFSLDVEGHELEVLEGFPWGAVPVGVLLFEALDVHKAAAAACRDLLRARTPLRFAARCGRSAAGCSEVWCDPEYFRRDRLFLADAARPQHDGWRRAEL